MEDSLQGLDTQAPSEAGQWMDVYDVKGHRLDVRIKVAGQDSRLYQRAMQEQAERFARRRERNLNVPATEIEESGYIVLATCTLDWENVIVDARPLPCNYINAVMLYRKYAALREQVTAFITNRSNYLNEVSENLPHGAAGASVSDSVAPTEVMPSNSSVN